MPVIIATNRRVKLAAQGIGTFFHPPCGLRKTVLLYTFIEDEEMT
jgi:hypothetical protein